MFGIDNFGTFIFAAIIVVVTPGVDTIMVLTRSISNGQKAGLYSALGVSLGLIGHTCAATFGLSQVLAKSAIAFSTIKYLGAAYLIYLGYRSLSHRKAHLEISSTTLKATPAKMFFTALMSDLLNPKIALFFLAFLPQFISREESNNAIPYLVLGMCMFVITLIWCSFLALAGSSAANTFNKNKLFQNLINKASGVVFILLGLKIALTKK
ncbi:LysE family translocator [Pedobacter sp. ASV28]|uniref:LysE family translocator n=1 Tax=Pedobacter sp. ASV28 TaxID=2795123 RepID=UPI0018EA4360|nr:LysE family translocator [Pedobacter sp. ASV28]